MTMVDPFVVCFVFIALTIFRLDDLFVKGEDRKQFKDQRFTIHSEQTCIVEIFFFDMIRFVGCNGVTIEIDDHFRKATGL